MPRKPKYADLSLPEVASLVTIVLRMPFAVLWFIVTNLGRHYQAKNFKRAVATSMIRWLNANCSVSQVQWLLPNSRDAYKAWAKRNNLPVTIEELIDDTALMWIGPKRTDQMILYIHGGAFFTPLLFFPPSFWRYVQLELAKSDRDVGFAILAYSLIPTAGFPIQLRQAVIAVEHIVASGVHPSNLPGAQLILALLSHILHPLDGVRKMIALEAPIRGVYLMSPWVCLRSTSASYRSKAKQDIFSTANVESFGQLVLSGVPEHQLNYVDPVNAPDSWFIGLNSIVERVLMSAGGSELFRDDIIRFSQSMSKINSNFSFEVQEGGIHNDPLIDFLVKLPPDQLGTLTPLIIHWLVAGIDPPQ